VRVIELAGIGPGPFAAMLLADMGAEVIRIERVTPQAGRPGADLATRDVINRGRRSVAVDIKHPGGRDLVLDLVERSDVLLEGFRPGVAERLGLGPDACLQRNPRLVYGRMTGWGQEGPLAQFAGHDINYISLTGALWATGRAQEKPVPPLNLVGDYGGGGMFLAFGVACALLEAGRSGQGQVVDAAMVDGSAVLSTMFTAMRAMGSWTNERGVNPLDTGFPHYEVYECADGKFISVGALEPQFYAELVRRTGFQDEGDRLDRATFADRKERWAALFLTKTRDEWAQIAAESDACLAPVLDWEEAPAHPHLQARGTYVEVDGIVQPTPAPRFSRTPGEIRRGPVPLGADTDAVLLELGRSRDEIDKLRADGLVGGGRPSPAARRSVPEVEIG
jgi:alpha-methylacyl-CoA racemase